MIVYDNKLWSRTFLNLSFVFRYFCVCYVTFIALQVSTNAQLTSCDYDGSGLDANGKEVQTVYLSCSGGYVRWTYPRGALRITIRNPDHGEFRGCIKSTTESAGARIFVEGHRTLIRVYPEDGPSKDSTRCFVSYRSQISLYVESTPRKEFKKVTTLFEYQLEPLTSEDYDPFDECQPCSTLQMLRTYCSADFAARGSFVSSEDNSESAQTIITFAAARVFQQNTPIFSSWRQFDDDQTGLADDKNKVTGSMEMTYVGRLRVPIKCEANIGAGEYVVMGTMRLGEPLLKCAAGIDKWKRFVAEEQHNARCILEQ